MQVILAKYAGACYGVNRSLELVDEAVDGESRVATLGALIHNPVVVDELNEKYGVRVLDDLHNVSDVDTIVIRSHGVTIDEQKQAEKFNVIDATCPHVKAVQQAAADLAKKYGQVIVVGKFGHPEVESVKSYIEAEDAKCYIWQNKDDIKAVSGKIGVVSQTTQSQEVFNNLINYMKDEGFDLDVKNTICAATQKRQDAALELARDVDAFVVIGGHNSSNTTHLAGLVDSVCKATYHVETLDELKKQINQFSQYKKVGVTAGASTPVSQIEPIINFLENI
ncbi:MAG: 4-hydroxy-3-methylbut-2-enyl diphosphate reductase [Coriobacteriia bacterium]|nr:4-hydroxy-3-methylbut-2-enyl diphosphate reductase [Coriobacteriia bacterium]